MWQSYNLAPAAFNTLFSVGREGSKILTHNVESMYARNEHVHAYVHDFMMIPDVDHITQKCIGKNAQAAHAAGCNRGSATAQLCLSRLGRGYGLAAAWLCGFVLA